MSSLLLFLPDCTGATTRWPAARCRWTAQEGGRDTPRIQPQWAWTIDGPLISPAASPRICLCIHTAHTTRMPLIISPGHDRPFRQPGNLQLGSALGLLNPSRTHDADRDQLTPVAICAVGMHYLCITFVTPVSPYGRGIVKAEETANTPTSLPVVDFARDMAWLLDIGRPDSVPSSLAAGRPARRADYNAPPDTE